MSAASYRLVIQSFSQSPDWIYVPGGILARNCAAMHTQKHELRDQLPYLRNKVADPLIVIGDLIEIGDQRLANIVGYRTDFDAVIFVVDAGNQGRADLEGTDLLRRQLESQEVHG